jgi:hypothetical protein
MFWVTKEAGAVPFVLKGERLGGSTLGVSSSRSTINEAGPYHFLHSKLEWRVDETREDLLCFLSFLLESRTRNPRWNVRHWAGR